MGGVDGGRHCVAHLLPGDVRVDDLLQEAAVVDVRSPPGAQCPISLLTNKLSSSWIRLKLLHRLDSPLVCFMATLISESKSSVEGSS